MTEPDWTGRDQLDNSAQNITGFVCGIHRERKHSEFRVLFWSVRIKDPAESTALKTSYSGLRGPMAQPPS